MAPRDRRRQAAAMRALVHRVRLWLRDDRGQGMVEYAFILVMVAVALLVIVAVIGHQTTNMYSNISNAFTGH